MENYKQNNYDSLGRALDRELHNAASRDAKYDRRVESDDASLMHMWKHRMRAEKASLKANFRTDQEFY